MLLCLCTNCPASESLQYMQQMTGYYPNPFSSQLNDIQLLFPANQYPAMNVSGMNTSSLALTPSIWNLPPIGYKPSLAYNYSVLCTVNRPTMGNVNGSTMATIIVGPVWTDARTRAA
jgi:hypothetical protein